MQSKAWPYEEARKLLKRWPDGKPAGDPVIFETGYGPSGLPHIGTWNEVARTTFVRHAYEELTGAPTRLMVLEYVKLVYAKLRMRFYPDASAGEQV